LSTKTTASIGFLPKQINIGQKRFLSTQVNNPNKDVRDLVTNLEFYEWLRGFTVGEGNFSVFKVNNSFKFRFQIKLHSDDRPL
jgi:hypothetical protein